jgi:flagellar biosynthesis protein FliQ
MGPDAVMDLGVETLTVVALICAPVLGVGLIVGLAISVFQAATQVSESTLSFLPKVAAMIAVLIVGGTWIIEQLMNFTIRIVERMGEVGQ